MARKVAAIMPPITVVAMDCHAAAPAPVENAGGSTPRMNAKEVVNIGRKRKRVASRAAVKRVKPSLTFTVANPTSKIALFAASSKSVTGLMWSKRH